MLNTAQNELLQQFLTEAQAERDELADQLEVKTAEYESLEDDLSSANNDKADNEERINALECALADALSMIAGDVLPSDLAETDAAFRKLYNVL